eukprot:2507672-Rhodomonas_salina.1
MVPRYSVVCSTEISSAATCYALRLVLTCTSPMSGTVTLRYAMLLPRSYAMPGTGLGRDSRY